MNDSEFVKRADAAAEEAAWTIVSVAREHDTPILVWANGETIEIDPYTERKVRHEIYDESKIEPSGESE